VIANVRCTSEVRRTSDWFDWNFFGCYTFAALTMEQIRQAEQLTFCDALVMEKKMSTVSVPEVKTDKGFLPRQTKVLLGAFVILGAIGFFIFSSLQGNQQYFLTLAEMQAKGDLARQQSVRVGGNLAPNTTKVNTKDVTAEFTITDGTTVLLVVYKGVLPDTFEKSTQVIAEGKLGSDGVFRATLVLAKCPSKYDPSQVEWHTSTDPGSLNYTAGK